MRITLEEVQNIASLARLRLTPEEAERLTEQLGKILLYMETLNRLETTDVEPFTHAAGVVNAFREDEVTHRPDTDALLANAPDKDRTFFKVPKIIE